jgi:hypothetical protein
MRQESNNRNSRKYLKQYGEKEMKNLWKGDSSEILIVIVLADYL